MKRPEQEQRTIHLHQAKHGPGITKRWDPILGYHPCKQIKGTRERQTIGRPPDIGLVDLVTRDMHVQNIATYYITPGGFQICLQALIISLGSFRQLPRPT